jgi:RimJ/RimL family protein N-acetyltransferase
MGACVRWHPGTVPLLPETLAAGPLELRRWRTDCLDELMSAVARSLPELQPWMPWASSMPTAEAELAVLMAGEAAFDADTEWGYALRELCSGDLVGGAGLHPRLGPDAIEIGYWVRTDRTRRGYATAAAQALTDAAFTHLSNVSRVEIHMDRMNEPSAAVPRKLGYRRDREEPRERLAPGHSGTGLIWVLDRPSVVTARVAQGRGAPAS